MSTNRVVDVIVGLQAGSEAKGKLISYLAGNYDALCRSGSINAAHTTYYKGKPYPWHQIPCGALHAPHAKIVLGAGAQISPTHLERELQWLKNNKCFLGEDGKPRIFIDPQATIIDDFDVYAENGYQDVCGPQWYNPTTCNFHNGSFGAQGAMKKMGTCEGCELYPKDSAHRAIGSTTHGSGMNLMRKLTRGTAMLRDDTGQAVPAPQLAKDHPACKEYLTNTVSLLNNMVDQGKAIMVEGTQGAVLSVHFGYWPKTTSRDTNASNWIMEMGLAPQTVRKVFGVCRTFPIRVAGNSGPMGAPEVSWEYVTKYAYGLDKEMSDQNLEQWLKDNKKQMFREITTATKRMRRVFTFSISDFERACQLNRPDELMLSFVDYLDANDFGKSKWEDLSERSRQWIEKLEAMTGKHITYLSTGPDVDQMIIRPRAFESTNPYAKNYDYQQSPSA